MIFVKFFNQFNLKKEADDLGISVWQTPSFLFIVMGLVIIAAMTGVYVISRNYDSPEVLIISESGVVMLLFTIGNFIIKSVEEVARANKMKTEFVSVASHQLKTPLVGMNWEIELLKSKYSDGLSEKQKNILGEIEKASARMNRLVNDLLDVARIDQKRLFLMKEKFDLCELIDDVVEDIRPLADVSGVKIIKSCGIRNMPIDGDKKRMGVAIDNLISNAIKYTNKQESVVEISIVANEEEIEVSVKDNGMGIPKHEQGRIFEKFFRSNTVTKNNTDGTGLGLYIARNIIEQSGGRMFFSSVENEGSIFGFVFPMEKE